MVDSTVSIDTVYHEIGILVMVGSETFFATVVYILKILAECRKSHFNDPD